jgi:hypothetical protein
MQSLVSRSHADNYMPNTSRFAHDTALGLSFLCRDAPQRVSTKGAILYLSVSSI